MRHRRDLLVGLLLLAGCSDAAIREDTPAACRNLIDDDGDGMVDCLDPDCAAAATCENSEALCRDGIDNDNNGLGDCQEPICIDLGLCEPFTPPDGCDVLTHDGCPRGLSCYVIDPDDNTERCSRPPPEPREHGEECVEEEALTGGCAPGHACSDGICLRLCVVDGDCPFDTRCFFNPAYGFGACVLKCSIVDGFDDECPAENVCGPVQAAVEVPITADTALTVCQPADMFTYGPVMEGEPCRSVDETSRCVEGLLCVPDEVGVARCRRPCMAFFRDEGDTPFSTDCERTEDCEPLYPSHPAFDDVETRGLALQGVCIER